MYVLTIDSYSKRPYREWTQRLNGVVTALRGPVKAKGNDLPFNNTPGIHPKWPTFTLNKSLRFNRIFISK